ncbi:uncharacterized protein LOC125801402 [Astyanax mexicanus]|uniref:uncharacterized protein LOC125801402 n=1 Tax=Astyanax mexicanus TaxID=7994 RepID=UPI0020CB5EF6|nr:uncharacterized protein LOC125801402 [Astyanax mexicanus]
MTDANQAEQQQKECPDVTAATRTLINLLTQSLSQGQGGQVQQQRQTLPPPSLPAPQPCIAQEMARSFPGFFKGAPQKRKFGRPILQPKTPKKNWKPFLINVFLLNKNTDSSPSPSEELELLQAGLGKRTISVAADLTHSELCGFLEAEFPKMKALTGGWLLYKAPGGNGRRKLGVVPPDSEGYTASLIRMVTSSGKTALYIVPLQDELSLDPLPFCAEEFEKMPKAECRQCKSTMPLQVLYLHVKSCGGAVSTDDEEMNSVIYDDEDATIVSEGNIGSSSSKIREVIHFYFVGSANKVH